MENREFSNGVYKEISNTIIPSNKKNGFILKLNVYAILLIAVLVVPTVMIFGSYSVEIAGIQSLYLLFVYMLSFIVFVIIHELLHGISFVIFGKVKFKELRFGIIWKSGMAYCISTVPVKMSASRISLMMPVYAVCIPMYIVGISMNNFGIAILSIFFLSGSVADFYYMWISRKADRSSYMFEEMPTTSGYEIGYRLYKKVDE